MSRDADDPRIDTRQWRKLRAQVVAEEPLCQLRLPGCTHLSTTADHILARCEWPGLKLVRENLRGSCESCNRKRGAGRQGRQQPQRAKALGFFDTEREPKRDLGFGA